MASSGVNVLRWSALGLGVFYGFYHQASITARDRLHASQAEYNRKEGLISQAKAEYARNTSPPEAAPTSKSDPKDDLEAFPWLQESKQSISRAIATSSRSIPRSLTLRSISRLSSRFQILAQSSLQSPGTLSAAFVQRRQYSDEAPVPPAVFGQGYQASETLYIGNLFFDTTPDQLKAYFGTWGEVTSVRIPTDIRGFVRGYGFVTFSNQDEADRARSSSNGQVFHGRRLVVGFASRRRVAEPATVDPKEPSSTLFVGNLAYTMTDKDLNDLFRPLRKICDVRVAIDRRTGQPRGFAHADFMDIESAAAAKKILEGQVVQGRELKIDFAVTREKPLPSKPLAQLIAEEQAVKVEVDNAVIAEAAEAQEGPIEVDEVVAEETAAEEQSETESNEPKSQAA